MKKTLFCVIALSVLFMTGCSQPTVSDGNKNANVSARAYTKADKAVAIVLVEGSAREAKKTPDPVILTLKDNHALRFCIINTFDDDISNVNIDFTDDPFEGGRHFDTGPIPSGGEKCTRSAKSKIRGPHFYYKVEVLDATLAQKPIAVADPQVIIN